MKNKDKSEFARLSRNVSRKLIDSLCLIEILEAVINADIKTEMLIKLLKRNIKPAFDEIENYRHKNYF